jgi:hypothetical protein
MPTAITGLRVNSYLLLTVGATFHIHKSIAKGEYPRKGTLPLSLTAVEQRKLVV